MQVTKRQNEILQFIEKYIEKNRCAPTYIEIADGVGVTSMATVHKHIKALERKGKITRGGGERRSIEILPEGAKVRFRFDSPNRLYDTVLDCFWVKEIQP